MLFFNIFLLLIIFSFIIYLMLHRASCDYDESFQLDHYLRPNYQSGIGMLRGDLQIAPVKQSWFNTRYGPSSLTPGFFNMN